MSDDHPYQEGFSGACFSGACAVCGFNWTTHPRPAEPAEPKHAPVRDVREPADTGGGEMTQPKPKKKPTMWVVEAQSIYGDWHPWVQATESEMLTSVEMLRNDEPEMKFRLRKYVRGGLMKKPRPSIKRFVSYWGRDAGLDVLMRRDLLALLREARSDAAAKERVKACHVGCPPARKRGGAE